MRFLLGGARMTRQSCKRGGCGSPSTICSTTIPLPLKNSCILSRNVDKIDGMTIADNRIPEITHLPERVCSACNTSVQSSANFCPNCGRQLRTIPLATTLSRQIIVYLISFFLAPFGLWFAWKYFKQGDDKSKKIGVVAIALTVISAALTTWTMAGLFNSFSSLLRPLGGLGL